MSLVRIPYTRIVEPCHPQVRPSDCADRPIPFADFLKKQNRLMDRFTLTGPEDHAIYQSPCPPKPCEPPVCDPCEKGEKGEEGREPVCPPEPADAESFLAPARAHIIERYVEVPTEPVSGRLIDLLM